MSTPQTIRLLTLELREEEDVVLARQRARQLAVALGFELRLQTHVATALSEIARNAFQYGRSGRVDFSVETGSAKTAGSRPRQSLVMEVHDRGPGMAMLEKVLSGTYHSPTGMGLGILGARKLMDRAEITTSPEGTHVVLAKALPVSDRPKTTPELQAIVDRLPRRAGVSALGESLAQNQELLRAIEEAREREEELARVNQELAVTNTGVLALYDELDTLHRISVTLASKLELRPLLQSIVDVTTGVTGADIGAFFLRDESSGTWELFAKAGPGEAVLDDFPASSAPDFFGSDFGPAGLIRFADLETHCEPCAYSGFARALADRLRLRSCLSVPVIDPGQSVLGALVFASQRPGIFSERSERILESVATQAVVGIEKARLFEDVTAANEAKDQFLAMLSHELRTPLNPVMAVISSMHDDARLPLELRQDLAVVWRNVRLEARLIDDLLDFNRLSKGKLQLALEPLDAHAIIRNVVVICREELEAKRHRLVTSLRADRPIVLGDSARLQQVLWNVLKNAVKFTPEGGLIEIETEDRNGMLEICIRDSGRGIDPASVETIFTAFEQGNAHRVGHFGGLGLGLSIARMFVDLHGGVISAASEGADRGTCISIRLPVTEAELPVPEPKAADGKPATASSHGTILLVDDHPDTLFTLERLLKRRGYAVVTAASGGAARRVLETMTPDLLISDLGLPDCSGHELLREIRATHRFPALALSGYGMESDVANSEAAGFQAHLTKPIDFEELARTVRKLLDSAG